MKQLVYAVLTIIGIILLYGIVERCMSQTASVPTLVFITVTPATASIKIKDTQQFSAICRWANNVTTDCTRSLLWTSSDLSVATFSTVTPGQAVGMKIGTTNISALSRKATSTTSVLTVTSLTRKSVKKK
jgi:trimeric autotransporter adhesin